MYKYGGVLLAILLSACTVTTPTSPDANARATTAVNLPASLALTPHLVVDPASPVVGTTATLSASVDEAVDPITYLWTFGDGYSTSTTSNRVDHVYAGTGLITSSVRVTDATARTGSASVLVTVQEKPVAPIPGDPPPPLKPAPPPAVFAVSVVCYGTPHILSPLNCEATLTLDGQSATGLLRRIEWDWDDGTPHAIGDTTKAVHIYMQGNRTYTITITVDLTTGHHGTATASVVLGI